MRVHVRVRACVCVRVCAPEQGVVFLGSDVMVFVNVSAGYHQVSRADATFTTPLADPLPGALLAAVVIDGVLRAVVTPQAFVVVACATVARQGRNCPTRVSGAGRALCGGQGVGC
jgi:hypothetical protein